MQNMGLKYWCVAAILGSVLLLAGCGSSSLKFDSETEGRFEVLNGKKDFSFEFRGKTYTFDSGEASLKSHETLKCPKVGGGDGDVYPVWHSDGSVEWKICHFSSLTLELVRADTETVYENNQKINYITERASGPFFVTWSESMAKKLLEMHMMLTAIASEVKPLSAVKIAGDKIGLDKDIRVEFAGDALEDSCPKKMQRTMKVSFYRRLTEEKEAEFVVSWCI